MHDIWNPWHGCIKCSPGCQNCYMYALDARRGLGYKSGIVLKTNNFDYPLKKDRKGNYKVKTGDRIRVNMTSDTFIEYADEWRDDMWKIIKKRSDVIFWILTKRPERIINCLPDDWGFGYDNVMMNCTCENQDMFDKRIDDFLNVPAAHKGLCLAPLISDIDISKALASGMIEEVSVGGENYDNPRPCRYEWVKHVADTCYQYKINFVWYESGTHFVDENNYCYTFEDKHKQAVYPWFMGLNQHYYDIKYNLKYEDGTSVLNKDYRERSFNSLSCLYCSNQTMCNGCSNCGKCGAGIQIKENDFFKYQWDMYQNQILPQWLFM